MRLFSLLALSAFAQDYEYETNYEYATAPPPASTVEAGTDVPIMADYVATTEEATTEETNTAAPAPTIDMANDFVATTTFPFEEADEVVFPQDMSGFARDGGSVNSISNLQLSLLPNADFEFTWDYDATHTDYTFEYQELVGNYQNSTDYIVYTSDPEPTMTTDGTTTTTTLTPTDTNKVFRVCILFSISLKI